MPHHNCPSKILIVGLPRTGTTSVCAELLTLGYRVAHTAYTAACVEAAEVIADTPAFADYRELNVIFKPDVWLYLHRPAASWLPSMRSFLSSLNNLPEGRLPPLFWRSLARVFGPNAVHASDQQLLSAYHRHQQDVLAAAQALGQRLINLQLQARTDADASAPDLLSQLQTASTENGLMPVAVGQHLNQGRISAWDSIRHPNKVASHLAGSARRRYFRYQDYGFGADVDLISASRGPNSRN